jgi:acyl-CoA synthetase (AMP-forming)/AMP-acid ligase II
MTTETIVSILRARAAKAPHHVLYTFLDDRGDGTRDVTYAELDQRARAIAVALRHHAAAGERVLHVFPAGVDFIFAFFGALYAGAIGVPLSPPAKENEIRRLMNTAEDARPACGMTTRADLQEASALARGPKGEPLSWLVPAEISLAQADEWRMPDLDPGSLAYLQYTSGSTGTPKGVTISHANVIANGAMIREAFELDDGATAVGWLPHSHDMGLIGQVLQPLFVDGHIVLMSPASFIRDPLRWLRAISKYRARIGGGPNFAYELCARRLARQKSVPDLDLSSWDLAFVGAEPVRVDTMRRFAEAFAPYGFDARALLPCYGLAEAMLLVTSERKGRGVRQGDDGRVSSGSPPTSQIVHVVDSVTGTPCADGQEGEVWVAGPHVSAGYWDRPAETEATFGGIIPGHAGRFLRTGDLAVRRDGALYVTGRIRDMVIVHGQNHYPQDIEGTAERSESRIRTSCSAVFGFEFGGLERIALVAEIAKSGDDESVEALCERIRAAVTDAHDVRLDVVVLLPMASLTKTTSGKVERQAMRRAFIDGTLRIVGYSSLLGPCDAPWDRAYRASA